MTEKYRDEPAEIRAEPLTASECGLRTRVIDLAALLIVTDVVSEALTHRFFNSTVVRLISLRRSAY